MIQIYLIVYLQHTNHSVDINQPPMEPVRDENGVHMRDSDGDIIMTDVESNDVRMDVQMGAVPPPAIIRSKSIS